MIRGFVAGLIALLFSVGSLYAADIAIVTPKGEGPYGEGDTLGVFLVVKGDEGDKGYWDVYTALVLQGTKLVVWTADGRVSERVEDIGPIKTVDIQGSVKDKVISFIPEFVLGSVEGIAGQYTLYAAICPAGTDVLKELQTKCKIAFQDIVLK